ncbi:methionine--tRNA ligase [Candidatus Saccharibacteria bacterium]|nr:methionine--tRNA ligase [Candidatus Saccharibacteria bacterium]
MKNIYITTAIPYVNCKPHLGHAMDYLLADIYARHQKQQGNAVRFQAGTDEHGNKIYKKAKELNIPASEYVNQNSAIFQEFIKNLGVEYTDFIRTTDQSHISRVQKIWQKLSPHIYSADYEGWYCEGCESFVTDKEYADNNGICPDHQTPYQRLSETNYYLRISDFKDQISSAINSGELTILPEFRKKEVLKLLVDSPDVSISRPTTQLTWGVPVPGDDSQVMYVWLDALSNYITVLGYPDDDISTYWPADLQIVGKDILRFHAIIWPAILLGLGLPLPRIILSHGFILSNGQKMSKSIGNVVDPTEVLERHGLDAFRYYFTRHIDTFADSDFTWEKFDAAYNNELANDLGNLVQRLAVLCYKNNVKAPEFTPVKDAEYSRLMSAYEFSNAMNYAWSKVQDINRRIDETKPWSKVKEDPEAGRELLQSLVSDLLSVNHLLYPFLPAVSTKITNIFSSGQDITPPAEPLFPKAA